MLMGQVLSEYGTGLAEAKVQAVRNAQRPEITSEVYWLSKLQC